jgi:hypothetical protein
MPVHAPLNPEKLYPAAGVADRATFVPSLKLAEQVVGQSIPAGLLVTVPLPETEILNWVVPEAVNAAETV